MEPGTLGLEGRDLTTAPTPPLSNVSGQCGPAVRALALRSGDPGFKTRSDRSLNLFLVVPGSSSQLHL